MTKKIFYIIAVVALILGFAAGIGYEIMTDKTEVAPEANDSVVHFDFSEQRIGTQIYDVPKTLTLDAQYVAMNFEGDPLFYEATIILDNVVSDTTGIQPRPIAIKTVFQVGPKCVMCTHGIAPVGQTPSVKYEVYNDFYLECMPIELPVKMTLSEMFEALDRTNIVRPESNVVVLRKPLMPPFKGPYYFLGTTKTGFISVNTENGWVNFVSMGFGKPLGEWP